MLQYVENTLIFFHTKISKKIIYWRTGLSGECHHQMFEIIVTLGGGGREECHILCEIKNVDFFEVLLYIVQQ